MKRWKIYILISMVMIVTIICTASLIFFTKKNNDGLYLSVLVTSYETNETMIMNVNCLDVANKLVEEVADIKYTSQYPLSVYDKKHDIVYYSARVDDNNTKGDQLFSYDIQRKKTEQLTTDIYAINYIYPVNDAVYLIVAMKGTHHLTLAKYEIGTKKLLVYDSLGKWNFELMTYDVHSGKIFATACLTEEQNKALDDANKTGAKYIAPNYTLFEFTDDFYNPVILMQTDKKLIRRMASRPDGKMFITLADSIPEWDPDYCSYILDTNTKKLTQAFNIDEVMFVSEFFYYLDDDRNVYFIGVDKDDDKSIRGLYRFNLDNHQLELIMPTDEGFMNSCFVFSK